MQRLRDQLEDKPWLKWVGAAAGAGLILLSLFWLVRPKPDAIMDGDWLAKSVAVRFEDTGDTMDVPIGFITRELIKRPGKADEAWKVTNPKTNQQSGVVTDGRAWSRIVAEVNNYKSP